MAVSNTALRKHRILYRALTAALAQNHTKRKQNSVTSQLAVLTATDWPLFYLVLGGISGLRHTSLPSARLIQSAPCHRLTLNSILILPLLRLGLPSGLFPSGLPTKTLHTFIFSPTPAIWPTHCFFFNMITQTYLFSSTNHEAPHYAVVSSLPLLVPFQNQISPFSRHASPPSAYVLPSN